MDNVTLRAYRTETIVEKWDDDGGAMAGPPDEVLTSAAWFEGDGTPVTDLQRIAEIESDIAVRSAEQE